MIAIEKRHEIEIKHTGWRRIIEWPHHRDDIGGCWGLEPRIEPILDARLKTPAAANIVSVVRPFDDPAPTGIHDFDLVTFFYGYHDVTNLGVDRAKMNKAFYDALKPGGELVVGDYSAKPGAGTSVAQTLHRSDEALASSEIEAAGFKLIDHGDFLHVPGDAREAHSHSAAEPVDIYVLKFRKPG